MSIVLAVTQLNLGSGKYPLPGWTNVDLHCEADIQADFRDLTFQDVKAIRMSHLLEHISWRETVDVLAHIRRWLASDGELVIEVPDMDEILAAGTQHPLWFKYVYGDQSHEGEYHLAGFTKQSLHDSLLAAGFEQVDVFGLISDHKGREGMPCLMAVAGP